MAVNMWKKVVPHCPECVGRQRRVHTSHLPVQARIELVVEKTFTAFLDSKLVYNTLTSTETFTQLVEKSVQISIPLPLLRNLVD